MNSTVLLTLASSGEGPHPLIDLDTSIVIQLFIFLATFLVAGSMLFKPYLAMRDKRREGMEGAQEEAARLVAEAEGKLADYEAKLASARTRAQDERRSIRAEAAKHHAEVTEKARAEAVAAMTAAQEKVDSEAKKAKDDLLPKAQGMGAQIASQLLGREVA